jgi:methyl-accepting chemotaxis protein PixJ
MTTFNSINHQDLATDELFQTGDLEDFMIIEDELNLEVDEADLLTAPTAEQSIEQSQVSAMPVNSPPKANPVDPMLQKAMAATLALKVELEKLGANPDHQKSIQFILQALQSSPQVSSRNGNTQQQLRAIRQQVAAIAQQMRQTTELDTLLKIATTKVQELLKADRVLVYRFTSETQGTVQAETMTAGWTPMLGEKVAAIAFGLEKAITYKQKQMSDLDNADQRELSPFQMQILEKYQVKAYLAIPVMVNGQVWGLFVAQHCVKARAWQEAEISLLSQVANELTLGLQPAAFRTQLQKQAEQDQALNKVVDKIRQALDIESIFGTATSELRKLLKCDRVAIYRFYENWSGEFITESVGTGWQRLVGPDIKTVWQDSHLQDTQGGRYRNHETFVVNDTYAMGHAQCHVEILEQFEAKAYVIAPVFSGEKLWGLVAAYQNTGTRNWQASEVGLVTQIGQQCGTAVQQKEYVEAIQAESKKAEKSVNREKALTKVISRIRQSLDLESIFQITTSEIRQFLECDRVAVYQFAPDWSGQFISESVATGWERLVGPDIKTVWQDTHLQDTRGGRYRNNETFVVNDIYLAGHSPCHLEILEQFQARAYIIVPVFAGEKLWGLLAAYQNSGVRSWEDAEVKLLTQVGIQFGAAVQQAEYLEQVKLQSESLIKATEQEKALTKVIGRIRQSLDLDSIFQITTMEIRQFLECDRVAVYRFNPDWSGEFIAESVATGWEKLVVPGGVRTVWADSHLQETKGGRYRDNDTFVVNDVYTIGHSSCHLEILEQFQVKAYMIVPVFSSGKLWGLLGAYQNSAARDWAVGEVKLLAQVGVQFGAAVQQAEYLNQVRAQSEKLSKLAKREANFTQIIYKIGQRIIDRIQRKTLNLDTLFAATAKELRQLLEADRVALYRFNPDWSGEFIAEDIAGGYVRLVGTELAIVHDPELQETRGGAFRNKETLTVEDIALNPRSIFQRETLEQWGVKAYMVTPVFKGDQLWGLLTTYQNSGARQWEDAEVNLLVQVAAQLGIALQQSEYLGQLQAQSHQLEEAAKREKAAKEQIQQRAVQLLKAVRPASQGDLTVRAPVTDDEVGTIADAYNNTLNSLRKIVTKVQETAAKVGQTSHRSGKAIAELAEQAQQEYQELTHALSQIEGMVDVTQAVAANAQQVEVAVQQANQIVRSGDEAMNRTVDGIMAIRGTVAETSKKIKRLSESSQKISKVVNLISNFTTQTQLLALNAAIEATRAGEYGRGFAVVADEVRSLAEQSAEATTEIEMLVQEIQAETSAVATAMDTGIEQVVGGTNLVNETRQNLNAIVAATAQISELVQGITQATQAQTGQSESVTQTMTKVAEIVNKTSADSVQISASFQELLATAEELQASVGQFKVS